MPRIPHLRPQNKWAGVDVPTQADFNNLEQGHVDCFNGDDGGDLTLLDTLAIGGAGMALNSAGSQIRGGVTTRNGGRLQLGNNDFDTYSPARSRSVVIPVRANQWQPASGAVPISTPYQGVQFTATAGGTTGDSLSVHLPPRVMHHGAVLDSCEVRWRVPVQRLVLPSGAQPFVGIFRATSAGSPAGLGSHAVAAGTAAAYYNSGQPQSATITGLAHTVDTASHWYFVTFDDESAIAMNDGTTFNGNVVHSIKLTFTTINDGHFQ